MRPELISPAATWYTFPVARDGVRCGAWPDEVLVRTVLWRRLDVAGLEEFRLRESAGGPRLEGTILLAQDAAPLRVDYEIVCTPEWHTRAVRVACVHRGAERRLELAVDGGVWRRGGEELPALAGCLDVDLSLTPATNTLSLRRLDLAVGAAAQVTAAWVLFPELTVQPLAQVYTRAAPGLLRYESATGFKTEVELDKLDLVVRYPPFWERVAAFDGGA